ncbi:MAG TPA: V-type ATP synthase subunit E family protein [Anaerolineaceae bacterium]
MTTVEENIDALSSAILSEARAEAEKIQSEASARADEIRRRAQEQADATRKEILDRANVEAERIRSQMMATAQMKARTLQLEHREKLLDQVFGAVREKLPGVPDSKDYDQIACNLLREALLQLKARKAVVGADAATQKQLTARVMADLTQELKTDLSNGKPLEQGIGVVVETDDGHLKYDNTLDIRLNRLQGGLRSSVYRILMGESL